MTILLSAISEGLLWAVMALGIYISFRILKRPDMTAEGAFPLGAALASTLIVQGLNPFMSTFLAFIAGSLAGAATGLLMTKGRVPGLLSGILVMTGLYSVNLRIMGRSNQSLLNHPRITSFFSEIMTLPNFYDTIFMGFLILAILIVLLNFFLSTDLGQALIATGDNENMARAMGIKTDAMKILGLALANGFVALSGALLAQANGYADISMGIGTLVIGLAAVIIVETVFPNLSMVWRLVSIPVGAIIYRFIIAAVLAFGLEPNDLKIVSAIILGIFLAFPNFINNQKGAE